MTRTKPPKKKTRPLQRQVAPPPRPAAQPDMFDQGRTILVQQQEQMSGPLPPPYMFAQYKQVAPEAAELILEMARKEQAHRHRLQEMLTGGELDVIKKAEDNRHKEVRFGQRGGLALASLVITAAAALVYFDKPLAVFGAVVGVHLAALLGVFMYGQVQQRKALQEAKEEAAAEESQQLAPPPGNG